MISMEDRLAIDTLYARNLWALDRGDADRFGATFTADGRLHMHESHEGPDALQAFIKRVCAEDVAWPFSQHHMSCLLIEEASAGLCLGQSYVMRVHRLPTRSRGNCQIIWSGHTQDRCVKADGEWRFAERRFKAWEGDVAPIDAATKTGEKGAAQ